MLAISLATGILFGLFPALEATSVDLRSALAEGSRGSTGSRRQWKRQALVFAEVALGQIKSLRQTAVPRNYEIWYVYATGYNSPLNKIINETLARNGHLTEADLEQIYASYFAGSRASDRIDTVNSRVLDEIKQVLDMIDAAAGSATSHSESPADANAKLAGAKDG